MNAHTFLAQPTYTIADPYQIGIPVAVVTDPCSGRVTAHYRSVNGWSEAIIGEPLCQGCDSPVADGPCGCVTYPDQVEAA